MKPVRKKSRRKRPGLEPRLAAVRLDPGGGTEELRDHEQLISELELQVTQLKLRENQLQEAEGGAEKQAAYYKQLFDSAPIGYMVLNTSGTIVEINEAGAMLLRQPRDGIMGESFTRFIFKKDVAVFLIHLRQCKDLTRRVRTELQMQVRGSLIPVELISEGFLGLDGFLRLRTTVMDISERRDAEQALRATERNHKDLVDSVQGVVWEGSTEHDGFTFISRHMEQMLGYRQEDWLNDSEFWQRCIYPDDRARVLEARRRAVRERKGYVIEFRMTSADRRVLWMRDSVNAIRDEKGGIKLLGIMMNITEVKEIEEALREETRILETLNRTGTSLAAELNLERLVQVITEAGQQVTGAQFAAFTYRQFNGRNGQIATYTTPGTPSDTFARLPMPEHRLSAPASEMEREIIRIEDVQDGRGRKPRSRIYERAAAAQGVRSYLAIPVVSPSGEPLGGLLFAHPAPGVFTERAQHLLVGIAAEAGIAMDNARLYRAMSKSEAHFRQLADAMPQIVWTAQTDGRVDYFNRRWHDYTGLPAGEKIETGWLASLHVDDCARCEKAWRKALATGEPLEMECRLKGRDGNYRWHLVRAIPLRDEEGIISSWFGTSTDIEDQKRVESEVRELNLALEKRVAERTAQLQDSNRELEAFSYSVSHDLRAPLRSIDAFSQLVREDYQDKLDDQGRQYLNIVGEASRHMGRLIDDLLYLSRVSRSELRRREVDLGKISEEIITRLKQLEPLRNVEIAIAPNLQADADERLMRVALENLINNAWKFTGRKPSARIEMGSEIKNGEQVFFVRDNGAGFDMEHSKMLFGAFQRLHTSAEFPGHGIGLATVQRIIGRHGGKIWANAAIDNGATFYFTLPKA